MKRIGALLLTFVILAFSMAGMWIYQSWKEEQEVAQIKEIYNAYIVKERGDTITVCSSEGSQKFTVREDIQDQEYRGIADVSLVNGEVEKLVCKPEQISGRVLSISVETMSVENYGDIPVDEKATCYTVNGEVLPASTEELYIGQTDASFAVAQGKICSVILPATAKVETDDVTEREKQEKRIRVLIKTDGYTAYEHGRVKLRATAKLFVKQGKEQKEYPAGEEVEFTAENISDERTVVSTEEGGKLQLLSVNRGCGNPLYRGQLELVRAEGGIHIINDVLLEEYLYGVIPSEMPAGYSPEALKAQAVCARSYALLHRKNHRLKEMGAHVDDSVSYQVYNNTLEDERCNQAVNETQGKKAVYDDKIVSTYFFSTSCGVTASSSDVFFTSNAVPYLMGKLQEKDFVAESQRESAKLVSDTYGDETLFRKFLSEDREVLEKNQPWYRWSTTISLSDIESNINERLSERCQASGNKIKVKQPDGSYQSQVITSIGKLKRIRIRERRSGGVAYMAVLVGTEAVVRVYSEYNIRTLIFHNQAVIRKNDGKNVSGLSMLPSGFFVLDKSGSSYEIQGGGFGHGTGMSQTGANELAAAGKTYEEILKYYFDGVEVKD